MSLAPFASPGSGVLTDHSGGKRTASGLEDYDRQISFGYVPVGLAATIPSAAQRA